MYRLNYGDSSVVPSKDYGRTSPSKVDNRPHPRGFERSSLSKLPTQDKQRSSTPYNRGVTKIPGVRQVPPSGG